MITDRITITPVANENKQLVVSHRLPRIAAVHDEEWIEGEPVPSPDAVVIYIKLQKPVADIFTFSRALPNKEASYPFRHEWDNVAVALLTNGFTPWWESLPQETRKNVRRSQRRGVSVHEVAFNDELVTGITRIYNETPIRQGRKFPHFGKTFDQAKAANASYLDRSIFIGAFFEGQLIGFIKMVMVNGLARIMQIVALDAHTDKRPTNALLAKAVEICCERGASHLIYGKYVYGRKENSPVTEFKRRNGFERLDYPRYYLPITPMGRLALAFGLHKGLTHFIPEPVTNWFLALRAARYRRQFRAAVPGVRAENLSPV
jgi:hypothetical protein